MKPFFRHVFLGIATLSAMTTYHLTTLAQEQGILDSFIQYQKNIQPNPPISGPSAPVVDPKTGVTKYSYVMTSQSYPLNVQVCADPVVPPNCNNLWTNTIDIYIPAKAQGSSALLYLGADETTGTSKVDFNAVSYATNMIIVGVGNIPFQGDESNGGGIAFPPFSDPTKLNYLAEDYLVAHTWRLFLNNPNPYPKDPNGYQFMPNHLPMTFAAVEAMDFIQGKYSTAPVKLPYSVQSFVVSGASKRGWATWLTALADTRVSLIVPVVIDFLNTKQNITRMIQIFNQYYPVAYYPYYGEGITPNDPNFDKLMSLQDPLSYLTTKADRFKISKYMVNSSGDDIFLPDNSQNYIGTLNSNGSLNNLRYMVNTGHEFDSNQLAIYSLIPILNYVQTQTTPPQMKWSVADSDKTHTLTINFDNASVKKKSLNKKSANKVTSIKVWQAVNPSYRDFRYACHINYAAQQTVDNPITGTYTFIITEPAQGWSSTFIELTYDNNFTITTPVFVYPTVFPSLTPPNATPTPIPVFDPSNPSNCSVLPPLSSRK